MAIKNDFWGYQEYFFVFCRYLNVIEQEHFFHKQECFLGLYFDPKKIVLDKSKNNS